MLHDINKGPMNLEQPYAQIDKKHLDQRKHKFVKPSNQMTGHPTKGRQGKTRTHQARPLTEDMSKW